MWKDVGDGSPSTPREALKGLLDLPRREYDQPSLDEGENSIARRGTIPSIFVLKVLGAGRALCFCGFEHN